VTPAEALAVIPRLPDLYDEPFCRPVPDPTFLVCELARRSVTVALTGDGGDELFGRVLSEIPLVPGGSGERTELDFPAWPDRCDASPECQ